MIEFWDYLLQFLAVAVGFCAALRAYLKSRGQPWFLLTCFYGTFALGTLYWTLHLLLRQETPQVFYVSDLAWLASYVFLLSLTLTLPDAGERQSRTGLCWLAPVFCLPQFGLYVTYGDLLLNVLMCGLTMMLAWCAMRGLVWAKRAENGRLRRFHGTVLAFIALEYALWTASCFWAVSYTHLHCVSIESISRHVGEAVHRGGRGAQCAIQERHARSAGAGGVGAEGAVAGTQRDAVLHSPSHSLGVVAACGNIREAHRALRLGSCLLYTSIAGHVSSCLLPV